MKVNRGTDTDRFYDIRSGLEQTLGKPTLSSCSGRSDWPDLGVYSAAN